jgi:hypothetical protein
MYRPSTQSYATRATCKIAARESIIVKGRAQAAAEGCLIASRADRRPRVTVKL